MGYDTSRIINSPLKKDGTGASNLAVNGAGAPQVFLYNPPAGYDVEIADICIIVETSNALSFGNKFIDTTIGTLANGLLIEIKADDQAYTWATCKRTRDLVEITKGEGLDMITGTVNFVRLCLWLPQHLRLFRTGTYTNPEYLKVTIQDDLRAISYMEMFFSGVKLP